MSSILIAVKIWAVVVFASLAWVTHTGNEATSSVRITVDYGGSIVKYIDKYNELRVSGERIVLDGVCISACTMITGLVPNEQVCKTPFAKLAFHSALEAGKWTEGALEATRLIWHIYPGYIRDLLRTKGWDGDDPRHAEHPDLIYVEGHELEGVYRPCTPEDLVPAPPAPKEGERHG